MTQEILDNKNSCPICGNKLTSIGRSNLISSNDHHSWESDSTFEILNVSKVLCCQKFCFKCFQSVITPQFDTSVLYSESAPKVRKKYFEKYNPKQIYDKPKSEFKLKSIFEKIERENKRFSQIAIFLKKHLSNSSVNSKKIELKVLDWGGADGFVGRQYLNMLGMATKLNTSLHIFDFGDWATHEGQAKSIYDLSAKGPFDVLIISHVLEHSHNPSTIISQALKYLSNEGILLIEVPDQRFTFLRNIVLRHSFLDFHVLHFSRRSLHSLLKSLGLVNIGTAYFPFTSYHGAKISTIFGVATKGDEIVFSKVPSRMFEIFSIFFSFFTKIIYKKF